MITILCPTYNEIGYIENLLKFLLQVEPAEKEIIFVDGQSTDGTNELLIEAAREHQNFRVLENPDRYVPYALNKGIKSAKGEVIIRIDAHTKYAPDYFTSIIQTFEEVDADIVGGPTRTAYRNDFQKAVGTAISHSFGVGNSKVHDEDHNGYVDSVTFGAWKKELFRDVGYFDERLVRNQDDEFHYRAKSMGKKIYLNSRIRLWYYPRDQVSGLFRQYFQYGLYKPMVLRKVRSEIKLRHLVPSAFSLYIMSLPIAILFPWYLIPLIAYSFIDIYVSLTIHRQIKDILNLLIIFPVLHLAYGLGFIAGIFKKGS